MISLAAATVGDLEPSAAVDVAARAGYGGVGIWFDPSSWTSSVARAVAERLADSGIVALDIEPVILGRGPDHGEAIIDAAGRDRRPSRAVGQRAGGKVGGRRAVRGFSCERAAGSNVTIALEFLPIFSVGSLDAALSVVAEAGCANGAVLVDSLHLAALGRHACRSRGHRAGTCCRTCRLPTPLLSLSIRHPQVFARKRCTAGCCLVRARCHW